MRNYRGKLLLQLVEADKRVYSQIDHFLRHSHAPKYHCTPLIAQIEANDDPSRIYETRMRELLLEQLDSSKVLVNDKTDSVGRANGVLEQLQKNSLAHRKAMEVKDRVRDVRERLFIDGQKVKDERIKEHIQKNYDRDIFNHQNDRYRQHQRLEQGLALAQVRRQQLLHSEKAKELLRSKLIQQAQCQKLEARLKVEIQQQKLQKVHSQTLYKHQLEQSVEEKNQCTPKAEEVSRMTRHNPITNPIEYHIDNPYILQRLQLRKTLIRH